MIDPDQYDGFATPEELNLTPEEIQELRTKKQELTEYGKEKIRELMKNQEPYPDEMFEEAERREKALKAVEKLYTENGDALKRLAEIETEERMTEEERIKVIQTAIAGIGQYSDALKELAKTEKAELKAELEAKKKENFQLVANACMKEYEKKYGELPNEDEYWRFMVSDYFGTGEGRTVSVLMTQANPYGDDFPPDGPNKYVPTTTKEYRSVREFHKYFGTWTLYGIRFLSREDFFETYGNFLPPALVNLKDKQCMLNYHGELHFNFS